MQPLTDMSSVQGAVTGNVKILIKLEGLAVLALALLLYYRADYSWLLFTVLILAPDLSMLGYLASARVGAITYNLVHTYVAPILLGIGLMLGERPLAAALIWAAHIGMDRSIGYGLKYHDAFSHTHLGRIGKRNPA